LWFPGISANKSVLVKQPMDDFDREELRHMIAVAFDDVPVPGYGRRVPFLLVTTKFGIPGAGAV
jgi:hypothetical protein